MRTLKLLIVCSAILLAGCLEGAGTATKGSGTTPNTPPVNGSQPSAGFTGMVSAVDKALVSSFGDTVNLTLSSFSGTVQSVTTGGNALTFSQSGSNLQVTVPEAEATGYLPIVVQDSANNTFGWNAGVYVTVQAGLQITNVQGDDLSYVDSTSNPCVAYFGVLNNGQILCSSASNTLLSVNPATSQVTTIPTDPTAQAIDSAITNGSDLYITYQYLNSGVFSQKVARTDLAGNVDATFSAPTISNPVLNNSPGFIADDGTNIYFAYEDSAYDMVIGRLSETGAVDTSFGTAGYVTVPCVQQSHTCMAWYSKIRMREVSGQLYFELAWYLNGGPDFVQYLLVLNPNGSTPAGLPSYLTQFSAPTDHFLGILNQILYGDGWSLFNIFEQGGQVYQMWGGQGGGIKRYNADMTIDTNYFSDAPINTSSSSIVTTTAIADRDYHTASSAAPHQIFNLSTTLPLNQDYQSDFTPTEVSMVDATPLPSGNVLALYLVVKGSSPQACFLIVGQDGAPIHANRATHFCQAITAQTDSGSDSLIFQLLRFPDGETFSKSGNTYTYTVVTDHVWAISVTVDEGNE